MGEKYKVSVIVPVYNVEKYVANCLDSIISQTLREIEIIVLNDGSTDGSLDICNRYAEIDARIKVYSHKNMGLGCTRNRGISLATGEYLAFVDSDDYIAKEGLKTLYEKGIETNSDVVQGETIYFDDGKDNERLRRSLKHIEEISINSSNIKEFLTNYYFKRIYSHNAWDKIYKRDFVVNNNIINGDNKRIFAEDNYFQLQIIHYWPKISFVDQPFYWYRQQANSIMHKPKQRLVERHNQMIKDYLQLLNDSGSLSIEYELCSIVAEDVLIMEALNQKLSNGNYRDYLSAMHVVTKCTTLKSLIKQLCKGAYRLEPKKEKRIYLWVIGLLYSMKLYGLAHLITWEAYRNK